MKLIPSRYPSRSTLDRPEIDKVMNECLFATFSYVEDGRAYAIPNGFCLAENQIMIHGSIKSRFLESILKASQVTVSMFLFDGLVAATSAFHMSVNYRSVTAFCLAEEVTESEKKARFFKSFTEKYYPGHWDSLRPMEDQEMAVTRVVSLDITDVILKKRSGMPGSTQDHWLQKVWTGIIPAAITFAPPVNSPDCPSEIPFPAHLSKALHSKS